VDIVKDEELLMDPGYCRRARRVELYMNAEKRAYEETGEHTLYAVNITDQVDRLLPNALEAMELGANALMVNYMHVGLEATRMLCTDPRITVPVLGHNSGVTSMLAGTHTGISAVLINGKLPRLAGVDMAIVLSGLGSFPILWERCLLLIREMLSPLYAIDPILPLVANGVTPGRVGRLVGAMGNEVALGAGSAIFGHPQGPAAGARAFRQAIQVAADGQDAANAAEDQPELAEALKLWGGD
jgi:2,3-diketo-5-methylthiopentyl-1-phosphate enolase